jgi:predicted RNA-binding protein with PUA-like domain
VNYWLLKSEPATFGIGHLAARPRRTAPWDGVRNYQARNYLKTMRRGDRALFYHSSCAEPAVVGIVEVVRAAYPDPTAWDPRSGHYDRRSTPAAPVWFMVDVRLVRALKRPVTLAAIKRSRALRRMPLVQRGSRLSVMPVTAPEWNAILQLERGGEKISDKPRRKNR